VVIIQAALNDTSGKNGAAVAVLDGQYGTLNSYYFSAKGIKTILKNNVGTIDYVNGIINLTSFAPIGIDNPLGQLAITANPTTTIISSTFDKIITVDPYDPLAITVNVSVKTK
jgi:hypothetical protein